MRVLVTRPQPDADRTAKHLVAGAMTPVCLPVSKVVETPAALRAAIGRRWSALALTSTNAVRALAGVPEVLSAWRDLPVFAVGARTAEEAARAGFARVQAGDGSGADLARLLAGAVTDETAPILYCAGYPRSSAFEASLDLAGRAFEAVTVYRMEPLVYPPEVLGRILVDLPFDATLFYSQATAEGFFRLSDGAGLTDRLRLGRILCLSAQVRAGLPAALQAAAWAADTPSEDRLLEMLAGMGI